MPKVFVLFLKKERKVLLAVQRYGLLQVFVFACVGFLFFFSLILLWLDRSGFLLDLLVSLTIIFYFADVILFKLQCLAAQYLGKKMDARVVVNFCFLIRLFISFQFFPDSTI